MDMIFNSLVFTGKITGQSHDHGKVWLVSGEDFPLNQPIDSNETGIAMRMVVLPTSTVQSSAACCA